jgi:pimeloyl-ACP methyl ester carboxylesterase
LAADHRVVRYDARGFGQSHDPTSEYDPIVDAIAVINAAGVSPAHLIGNSMGATVARGVAIVYPAGVRSLTLVGPGIGIDTVHGDAARKLDDWREAVWRGRRGQARRITPHA